MLAAFAPMPWSMQKIGAISRCKSTPFVAKPCDDAPQRRISTWFVVSDRAAFRNGSHG
jgi:hypothetical protein